MNGRRTLERVAILGATGRAGEALARTLLLRNDGRELLLVSRDARKAIHLAERLRAETDTDQTLVGIGLDYENDDALAECMASATCIFVAAPLSASVACAMSRVLCATTGTVVALAHDNAFSDALQGASKGLSAAGSRVVLDAGADPGLPGVVGLIAARRRRRAKRLDIFARYKDPWMGDEGLVDLLETARQRPMIWRNGRWRRSSAFRVRWVRWSGALGPSLAAPVFLPELGALAQRLACQDLTLWHGGQNWAVDAFLYFNRLMPWALGSRQRQLAWIKRAMSGRPSPSQGLSIVAVARDERGATKVAIAHDDVYEATAQSALLAARVVTESNGRVSGCGFLHEWASEDRFTAGLSELGFDLHIA